MLKKKKANKYISEGVSVFGDRFWVLKTPTDEIMFNKKYFTLDEIRNKRNKIYV